MKRLWNYLTRIGIDGQTLPAETRYIVFANAIVVLVLILIAQNLAINLLYHVNRVLVYVVIAHGVFIGIGLLWNKLKFYLLARVWFGVWATVFLTSYQALIGTDSRWDVFLVVCVFLQFFMFPAWQRKWMYLVIAFICFCFFCVDFIFHTPRRGLLPGLPAAYINVETAGNLAGFLFCGIAMGSVAYVVINRAERDLAAERDRSDILLNNILPAPIAARLKDSQATIADDFQETSILFADIAGFTKYTETVTPDKLLELLNSVFSEFDDLCDKYDAEKIKTIGDAYMVVAGVPVNCADHAGKLANMALDMQLAIARHNAALGQTLKIRVGIHSGPVIAGVIGKKKFAYDLWGDSVNTAARMESHGIPGEIQVSEATYQLLQPKYHFMERGMIDIKGKGPMKAYLLKGRVESIIE